MRLHRFLLTELAFASDKIIIKDKNLLNQLVNVFRMKKGAQCIIFDGTGTEFVAELVEIERKEIVARIVEENNGLKRNKRLTLVFSMIKKENMC